MLLVQGTHLAQKGLMVRKINDKNSTYEKCKSDGKDLVKLMPKAAKKGLNKERTECIHTKVFNIGIIGNLNIK